MHIVPGLQLNNLRLEDLSVPADFRFRILLPSEIERWLVSKPKRDAVHNVVHAFRSACGVPENQRDPLPRWYLQAVELLARAPIPANLGEERGLIKKISTPDEYLKIRQCSRMRMSVDTLTPQGLQRLCGEIRVALIWCSLKQSKQCISVSPESMSA